MPYIYRVENKNKEGCYMGKEYEKGMKTAIGSHFLKGGDKKHPLVWKDKGMSRNSRKGEICGFKNKAQTYKWFTKKELKALSELGYKLKRVVVKKITAIGEKQILAIR